LISTDESRERALESGAYAFVAKPIQSKDTLDGLLRRLKQFSQRAMRSVVVVSDNAQMRGWLGQQIKADDLEVYEASDYAGARQLCTTQSVDCLVLDAALVAAGRPLLGESFDDEPMLDHLPIVIYGDGGDVDARNAWRTLAAGTTLREVRSPERLLEQVSAFLHRNAATMPEPHRAVLHRLHEGDHALRGKRVMIVDDDMRNIFALSSLLEEQGMVVDAHDNGRDAIHHLRANADIDVVLMDIMMPELDGIETIREIRKIAACGDLPIIAVTAKAMKGDREKCMEAGAWDYLSKPVDAELMISVLRAWVGR
jgi:CheY-like chemotaxis protein